MTKHASKKARSTIPANVRIKPGDKPSLPHLKPGAAAKPFMKPSKGKSIREARGRPGKPPGGPPPIAQFH